jgi:diaminopimelate decarboxylase
VTLPELLPSLRSSLPPHLDPNIWPLTAREGLCGEVLVGGVELSKIAKEYGTPTYVLDETDIRQRCRDYRAAFPEAEVAYASKALLCRAVAGWVQEEGLSLDVCSAGEIAVAAAAGFPAWRMVLHGNAKTPQDLRAALDYHVGRIVIDSVGEIAQLAANVHRRQRVLLRLTPGVDAETHTALTTATEEQKFGLSLTSGAAADAARRVLGQPKLNLVGVHCHLGSQIARFGGYEQAVQRLVAFMAWLRDECHTTLEELNIGGGHAVPYVSGDNGFALNAFAGRIRRVLHVECDRYHLPLPRITIEPGRAIVARAGVTLYRVIAIKRTAGGQRLVAIDGGMSDNLRPCLYGASYTARLVGRPLTADMEPTTVVGRHCEAGDVVARNVPLPIDAHPGDVLAVPCSGAYHHSLASNYNLVGRPPIIAVRDGSARTLIRCETTEDLLARDIGL